MAAILVLAMLTAPLVYAASAQVPYPGKSGAFDQETATDPAAPEAALRGPAIVNPPLGADSTRERDSEKQNLNAFFLIGAVINIVMLFVVGIWAYHEWRKRS